MCQEKNAQIVQDLGLVPLVKELKKLTYVIWSRERGHRERGEKRHPDLELWRQVCVRGIKIVYIASEDKARSTLWKLQIDKEENLYQLKELPGAHRAWPDATGGSVLLRGCQSSSSPMMHPQLLVSIPFPRLSLVVLSITFILCLYLLLEHKARASCVLYT